MARLQTDALAQFTCLGAACPDGCCNGWSMQVDDATLARYKESAPELLNSVMEDDSGIAMRQDAPKGACVQLDAGWCKIHRDYGTDFLGDACHYYPRIPRAFGDHVVVSGALSCPELARIALTEPNPFAFTSFGDPRSPYVLTNFLPEDMSEAQGLTIHQSLLAVAGDESVSAEQSVMRLSSIARTLDILPKAQWHEALPLYIKLADGRLPTAEPNMNDPFNLAHGLQGLIAAASLERPRLNAIVARLADALGIVFENSGLRLVDDAAARAVRMLARTRDAKLQPILRRYLQAQLSQCLFPFSGLGSTLTERITIIAVRFATLKLALASLEEWNTQSIIDTVQPFSRFMDHLADPTLSLMMYEQTGWLREARLRGLLGI